MIYFIQQGKGGPIKIGYSKTLDSVKERLKTFQTGCAQPLSLLGVERGSLEVEAALHQRYAAHRLSGEWFEPVEELYHRAVEAGLYVRWMEWGLMDDGFSLTPAGEWYLICLEEVADDQMNLRAGAALCRDWVSGKTPVPPGRLLVKYADV